MYKLPAMKTPEIQARFEAGEDVIEELYTMLMCWLYNHIRGDDQGYAECIKKYLHQDAVPAYGAHSHHAAGIQEMQANRQSGFFTRLKHAFFPERNHI